MAPSEVHVACCFNVGHVPHVAALIESVSRSNRQAGVFLHLVVDGTVDPELERLLAEFCERRGLRMEFSRPPSALLSRLPPAGRYPPVIWYRVLLPELFPELDRVIYLDGDTLVMQDLWPLWQTDLGPHLLGAIASPRSQSSNQRLAKLGISPDQPFFNSGVLLLDLHAMRLSDICTEVFAVGTRRAAELHYPDQDALNLACRERWLPLHPRWNALSWYFMPEGPGAPSPDLPHTVNEAIASPAIIHFEGSGYAKPWNARSMHPFRHLYREYRAGSPWPMKKAPRSWQALQGRLQYRLQRALTVLSSVLSAPSRRDS